MGRKKTLKITIFFDIHTKDPGNRFIKTKIKIKKLIVYKVRMFLHFSYYGDCGYIGRSKQFKL